LKRETALIELYIIGDSLINIYKIQKC